MGLVKLVTTLAIAIGIAACSGFGERYAAEVGYQQGSETRWDIWGDYTSLDECRTAAMDRYNQYYAEGRATSWACLKKNREGGYESRHR
jgi:hypothetical protein